MRRFLVLTTCLSLALSACFSSEITQKDQDDGVRARCGEPSPGETPIRRLTQTEFVNTLQDLLGPSLEGYGGLAEGFPPEEQALGFDNNAFAQTVSPVLAETYLKKLEELSLHVTTDVDTFIGCDSAVADTSCVRDFIAGFGKRAWRRPLAADEIEALESFFVAMREEFNPRAAIRLVVERFLQSPYFLYRVEATKAAATGVARVGPYELASRLSYLLWNSMPDDELMRAAEAGELETAAQVEAQARRMLQDEHARHRATVANFSNQWLALDRIAGIEKDPNMFPDFDDELAYLLGEEARAFIDRTVWDENGGFTDLMTASHSYLDPRLAGFYGAELPAGAAPDDGELVRVDLDPQRRAGLLTLGGIMAEHANVNQTNPVLRGLLVREKFFCYRPDPPPDNVDLMPPPIADDVTGRERWAQHSQDPACSGCHALLDPVGFGFENFDAAGQWRDTEAGQPIDASGELVATDVDRSFVGPRQLSEAIAESRQAQECFVTQWFRFGYGRGEGTSDQCNRDFLFDRFEESGGDIRELLVALTQTDNFLYKTVEAAQ